MKIIFSSLLFILTATSLRAASGGISLHYTGTNAFYYPGTITVSPETGCGFGGSLPGYTRSGFWVYPGDNVIGQTWSSPDIAWNNCADQSVYVAFYGADGSSGSYHVPYNQTMVLPWAGASITETPVYTNFTFTICNTLSGPGKATWTYNGQMVKQMVLKPGACDAWTTPQLKVSPAPPDNFTFNGTLVPVNQVLGFDTNGTPSFMTDTNGGNSVTYTNGSNTDTITSGTNSGSYFPQTNTIVWQPPTGLASESTLQAGFSAAYKQGQDFVNGLAVLHQDLATTLHSDLQTINSSIKASVSSNTVNLTVTNTGSTNVDYTGLLGSLLTNSYDLSTKFGTFTNEEGLIISYMAVLSNDVFQITREFTNNPPTNHISLTNQLQFTNNLSVTNTLQTTNVFSVTNQLSLTNNVNVSLTNNVTVSVTNSLLVTNTFDFTNAPDWTNGLTLEQYSNYMNPAVIQQQLTNQLPSTTANTNAAQQLADTSGIRGFAQSLPAVGDDGAGGAAPQNINLGHGIVIALGTNIPSSFNAIRGLIAWCIIIVLIFANYKTSIDACSMVLHTPQATTAGEEILGTNANAASAIAMGLLIVAAASGVPAIAAGFMANELALIHTNNPLNFLEATLGWGYSFLSQYIPIYTLATALCSRFAFYVLIRGVALIAAGVVKLLTGL